MKPRYRIAIVGAAAFVSAAIMLAPARGFGQGSDD